MRKLRMLTFVSLGLAWLSAHAQSRFQNLNFEAADLSNPTGMYNEVPISQALPGWSGSIGGVAVSEIWADEDSAGTATIDVEGPNATATRIGPLDGDYSVYLQAFNSGQGNVSIWQSGTIPANALSLEFEAWKVQPSAAFSVSFDGNTLSPVVLSSGQSAFGQTYDIYGANIGSYAHQLTGILEFTALATGLGESSTEFDDITFSSTTVTPEPNTLALAVMGGLALAARRWRGKGSWR